MTELRVRRDDLSQAERTEGEPPKAEADLRDGEAQLRIDRFALTANNITYGVIGEMLGYWKLFPAGEGWGRIPAWGYSTVTASRAEGVEEGERVWGLVPMASRLTVEPAANPIGFLDAAEHRAAMSPVYSTYLRVGEDASDHELVLRPLFTTSVLLGRHLNDSIEGGASAVVLTSASSKTAFGLAHQLVERPVRVIGLTSPHRVEWVEGLGLYDEVHPYDEVEEVEAGDDAVLVDFAGDAGLVKRAHVALGDSLSRSVGVGMTHWETLGTEVELAGPTPEFFFAPDEMVKQGAELAEAYAGAWASFEPVAERVIEIKEVSGEEALLGVYGDLLAGRADASAGFVVSL